MFRIGLAIAAIAPLAACVPSTTLVMYRADGKTIGSNPALSQQAQQDLTVCRGEFSKAQLTAPVIYATQLMTDVYVGCMARRGYVLTPKQ
ncbi:hypothetical protein AB4099_31370 [Bosea sp. 2KB_26]|uniref:hypothetical protein n=1 Tax=Bosea sp. 2KB_26 TaxID=3237475 RepID=UPI000DE32B4F